MGRSTAWIFRTSWPETVFIGGQNGGKGGAMLTFIELAFAFGVLTFVPIFVKIDQEMRP